MTVSVGGLLRSWRERRHLTQLALSLRAGVSTRHLSFVETGRSRPTRDMILLLSERLDIPLPERNALLLAGGYAPRYPQHGLSDPPMAAVGRAINQILAAHEPFPAVVIDRRWDLVAANAPVDLLLAGSADHLLEPPVNVLRLSLHPDGMASRIANLGQWRAHLLERLGREVYLTGDAELVRLRDELEDYPAPAPAPAHAEAPEPDAVVIPLRIRVPGGELSLFSTTTVFGTPQSVTVAELAIESFYPADRYTTEFLRASPLTSRSAAAGTEPS